MMDGGAAVQSVTLSKIISKESCQRATVARCSPRQPAAGVEEMKVCALPSISLHSKVQKTSDAVPSHMRTLHMIKEGMEM